VNWGSVLGYRICGFMVDNHTSLSVLISLHSLILMRTDVRGTLTVYVLVEFSVLIPLCRMSHMYDSRPVGRITITRLTIFSRESSSHVTDRRGKRRNY
jgi:hypothetical protein